MTWSISAAENSATLPGSVKISLVAEAPDIVVWRSSDVSADGREAVRGLHTVPVGQVVTALDSEPPLGTWVQYKLVSGGQVRAVSPRIHIPPLADGMVLLRSVLAPQVKWMPSILQDQKGIERETRSAVHPVLGAAGPVVVGDVRRLESSTFIFLAQSIDEANRIIDIFQEGTPVMIRTPCTSKVRDQIVAGLNYREERFGTNGKRLCFIDVQQIDWPSDRPDAPISPTWIYHDLDVQTTAQTYNILYATRPTYFDLAVNPVSP